MPLYDYACAACGPFSAYRPMSEFDRPAPCNTCGAQAPRAILKAPALAMMESGARQGMEVNERSRHEPRLSRSAHPSGCGCCGSSQRMSGSLARAGRGGAAKSYPGARPWMLSH